MSLFFDTGSGGEESILGYWAGEGVAADGTMEGASGATSASYILDFVWFNYASLFLVSQVVVLPYQQGRLGLGYK